MSNFNLERLQRHFQHLSTHGNTAASAGTAGVDAAAHTHSNLRHNSDGHDHDGHEDGEGEEDFIDDDEEAYYAAAHAQAQAALNNTKAAPNGTPAGGDGTAARPSQLTRDQQMMMQFLRGGGALPEHLAAMVPPLGASYGHQHTGHAHGHPAAAHSMHRAAGDHDVDDEDDYLDDDDEDEDDYEDDDGDDSDVHGHEHVASNDNGYYYGEDPYGEAGAGSDYERLMLQQQQLLLQQQQAQYQLRLAQAHAQAQADAAAAAAAAAEEEDPDLLDQRDAAAEKELGNEALRREDFAAAVEHYSRAIELWPHDWVFYANRAAAHIKLGAWQAGAADCDAALRLEPNSPKPLYRLALCHLSQAQFSQAKAALARLEGGAALDASVRKLASEIAEVEDVLRSVDTLLHEDKPAEAEEALATVAARVENTLPLRLLRARVLLGHGRTEQAQKILLALAKQPENAQNVDIVLWRGVAFYADGEDELATRHFTEVLRVDPDNRKAITMFKLMRKLESCKKEANDLFKAGRHRDAVSAFSAALRLDAKNEQYNAVILGNRAAAYMALREWDAAAQDCTQSLSLRGGNAKLHARRARCWVSLNLLDDAVRDFERSLKISQDDAVEEELKVVRVSIKRSKQSSFYSLLGVSVTASVDEIKRSYRRLAMQWHPDRQTGGPAELKAAEDKFKKLTEAYEVLSDAEKKRKYDLGYELDEINSDTGGHGGGRYGRGGGHDQQDLFNMFFNSRRR